MFLTAEIFILLSAVLSWQLYKQLIQPLQTLMSGVEAIKAHDFNVKFVLTGKYEMDQLIAVYNSMMDELRNERTKQEQQHFFLEKLIHTSPTGIVILDHDNIVQQLNPVAENLLGLRRTDFLFDKATSQSSPMMSEILALKTGEAKTISLNGINTYKLQKSHFIDRGFARSFVMIEELTIELLAAEKRAYGKVIRMMAHEVNNTIGPVNSIIDSTLKSSEMGQLTVNQLLKEALEVAYQRNLNLNIFMRNFADVVRLPEPNKKKFDLHLILHRVVTLLKYKLVEGGKKVAVDFTLVNEPFLILADEQLMEQAFINIVKNAIEAIEGDGRLEINTSIHPEKLMICNTGKGIDAMVSEQLFTPFFSTKRDGQGIGLTLVKEILLNHRFPFSLKTERADWTVFTIEF